MIDILKSFIQLFNWVICLGGCDIKVEKVICDETIPFQLKISNQKTFDSLLNKRLIKNGALDPVTKTMNMPSFFKYFSIRNSNRLKISDLDAYSNCKKISEIKFVTLFKSNNLLQVMDAKNVQKEKSLKTSSIKIVNNNFYWLVETKNERQYNETDGLYHIKKIPVSQTLYSQKNQYFSGNCNQLEKPMPKYSMNCVFHDYNPKLNISYSFIFYGQSVESFTYIYEETKKLLISKD